MQTSEVLHKAADHIQQYGHQQGSGFGEGSALTAPACAHGAISVAMGHDTETGVAARDALAVYLGTWIVSWNDAPERTASEVIEALRAAALIEAAKENAETREQVSA